MADELLALVLAGTKRATASLAQFASDEGEGDRTLAWWLDAHRRYFTRQAAREGFAMHDAIGTVFERFEVVWPPEAADRPA